MTTARQQTLVVTEKRLQHEVIVAEPPQRAILAAGQQGPRGPASPYHRHDQVTSTDTWTVNHNFNSRPLVSVFGTGGREMWAEVVHASDNQALIYFDAPTAGYAICT